MSKKKHDLPGIAHDLNNVFQTLIGVAAQLEHDPELAAAIFRSVERGQNIVAGLQQRGSAVTSFDAVLANAIAFLDDFRIASNGPPVAIVSQADPGIVLPGHWDWERVFVNLFLNSVRAMPEGGTIHVTAVYTIGGVKISVADEGTGIAPELLGRLFEPHVSGNASTGLGLSIVESIVHDNGGTVQAHNRARGAEFVIHIPAPKRAATA
ncbi:MAG: HAMP domain-containing sensor histidine kinase [Acidobacteriota bacterium]